MAKAELPAVRKFTLAEVTIRPATLADMPAKRAVNAHYVFE